MRLLYSSVSTLHIYIEQINLSLGRKMEPEERGEQSFSFFFLVENRSTGCWRGFINGNGVMKYRVEMIIRDI